jgi:hypothetical protein
MKRIAFATLAFALASLPLAALAQDEPPPLQPDAPPEVVTPHEAPPPGPPRYDYWRIGLGARLGYVTSGGYDQFASNDVLSQFSIEGTKTFLKSGRFSLATGVAWDVGGRASGMRGIDTSLTTHRFTVPLEGRVHIAPWLYGFVRVAPGAAVLQAKIDDPSSQSRLADSAWVFAGDASMGASVLLGPRNDYDKRAVRFWLTPEVGWSVTTQASFAPNPGRDDKDVLGTDASMRIQPLALSGAFWRMSAAVTF